MIGMLTGLTHLCVKVDGQSFADAFFPSRYLIGETQMRATLPSEIGLLTALTWLVIYNNGRGMSGTIPSELGRLTRLQQFDVSSNSLSSTIPSTLGRLASVVTL